MLVLGRPLLQLRHTASSCTRTTTALHQSFRHPFFSSSNLTLSAGPLSRLDGERRVAGPAAFSPVDVFRSASGFVSGLGFWFCLECNRFRFDVKGYMTGFGNPEWKRTHQEAEKTAIVVTALLKNGATCVGKTVMDEFSFGISGENKYYGTPTNPQMPSCILGGSSSGSAVAVAAGLVDFDIESVFVEVEPILRSAMDGHNVCFCLWSNRHRQDVHHDELQRTNLELESHKENIKENQEKIKLNM